MIVRVRVSSERPTETVKELIACAGFDPKHDDGYLTWEFHSRETGNFFLIHAQVTAGVMKAEAMY